MDTLVGKKNLGKYELNKLKNPETATVDRQIGSETHANIAYQVGAKKSNNRDTYGMTFVDRNAVIFSATTGEYVTNAIDSSVKDSYRYTVNVRIEYFDESVGYWQWKSPDNEPGKQAIIKACGTLANNPERIEAENIKQLNIAMQQAKTDAIASVFIYEIEKILKSILSKNRDEIEVINENDLVGFFVGIFCVSERDNQQDLRKACDAFEACLKSLKDSFPESGEKISRVVDIDLLAKQVRKSGSFE